MLNKIYIYIFIFLNISNSLSAQTNKEEVEKLIFLYTNNSVSAQKYFFANDTALLIYNDYNKRLDNKKAYEFALLYKDWDNYKKIVNSKDSGIVNSIFSRSQSLPQIKSDLTKPLLGKRIALDPGHVSATIEQARIEKKMLEFKPDSAKGLFEKVEIIEANSTLATAKLLKKKLEEAGAEVFLTRKEAGKSSFGKSFEEWYNEEYVNQNSKPGKVNAFSSNFNQKDLNNRAKIINLYQPDITVIIHFNVDEKNSPWTKPANKNFNMIFVAECDKISNLDSRMNRIRFAKLLIQNPYEESLKLGGTLLSAFENILKVPIANTSDATYLVEKSKPTKVKGVYERGLALTRMINGVCAYGETLYQDNIKECKMLNNKTKEIDGVKYSERIEQVADAYYKGILNYFEK